MPLLIHNNFTVSKAWKTNLSPMCRRAETLQLKKRSPDWLVHRGEISKRDRRAYIHTPPHISYWVLSVLDYKAVNTVTVSTGYPKIDLKLPIKEGPVCMCTKAEALKSCRWSLWVVQTVEAFHVYSCYNHKLQWSKMGFIAKNLKGADMHFS